MRVNTELLEDRIKTCGIKKGFLCEQMGISRQAFNKKVKNVYPFRASEVYVLCDILAITPQEKPNFFIFNMTN